MKIKNEIEIIAKNMKNFSVVDSATQKKGADTVVFLSKLSKELEKKRKDEVAPFKTEIKAYEQQYNIIIDRVSEILEPIKKEYENYTREQERLEKERLEKERIEQIKQAQKEAEEAMKTFDKVTAETGVDLSDQKSLVALEATKQIQSLAEEKINVKVTTRSNMGTVTSRKTYKGEIVDKIDFIRWIIKAYEAGADYTDMIEFKQSAINAFCNRDKIKELVDKSSNGYYINNGLKAFIDTAMMVR